MAEYTQAGRPISITTPLGEDALLLRSFTGYEGISQPFRFDLDLLSENNTIVFDDIVGKDVTINVVLADGSKRYWNGRISRFSQGAHEGRLSTYRAEMVPWLWFLTRTADCRIFQNKTAPDIVKVIFEDLGFQDFSLRLQGSFVERTYCVQYRETDFNFVSRMLQEEGIFYFFEQEDGKHTLVLGNDPGVHAGCPNQNTVRYAHTLGGRRDDDVITDWSAEQELRPGAWAYADYNFETPGTSLLVQAPGENDYEIYDYPGEYRQRIDGDTLARIRREEQAMPGLVLRGSSDCRAFASGYTFDLVDHHRKDMNQTYLLTGVWHSGSAGGSYETGGAGGDGPIYSNTFDCIPSATVYRPPRVTPQPLVQGCQSAVVVGPAGEEIHTDKYGRIKVQFHWDREGELNENSSCWIRVATPWAGKGWGGVHIPRIGQEVLVDFLEGNPNQPIVIGSVFNAQQMPPFGLPAGAVVSGLKSNSTKGGGGYNQISLNDTKGTELIQIHGQYDMDTKIEHDERVNIGNNRTEKVGVDEQIAIGNDRTEEVGNNEKIMIGVDRSEEVGSNEKIVIGVNRDKTVGGDQSEDIGGNKVITVTGNHTEAISGNMTQTVSIAKAETITAAKALSIGAAYQVSVGAAMNETVGGLKGEEIGGAKTVAVGGLSSEQVGINKSVNAGKDISESAGANFSINAGKDLSAQAGKKMALSSGDDFSVSGGKKGVISIADELTITCGKASITMKKNGDITIGGKKITIKGSGDVKIDGSKVNIK